MKRLMTILLISACGLSSAQPQDTPASPTQMRERLEARLEMVRSVEARLVAALADLDSGYSDNSPADAYAAMKSAPAAEPESQPADELSDRPDGRQAHRERRDRPLRGEGGRRPPPPIEDDPVYQQMQTQAPRLAERIAEQSRVRPERTQRFLEQIEPRMDMIDRQRQIDPRSAALRLELVDIDTRFDELRASEPGIQPDDPRLLALAEERFEAQMKIGREEVAALEQRLELLRTGLDRRAQNKDRVLRFMIQKALRGFPRQETDSADD